MRRLHGGSIQTWRKQSVIWFSTQAAQRPTCIILLCLVICLLVSCVGLPFSTMIVDQGDLWSSSESKGRILEGRYEDYYGPFYRTNSLLITVKESQVEALGDDVIQVKVLEEVFLLQKKIEELEFSGVTLEDICLKPIHNGTCFITSVLFFWDMDADKMRADTDLHRTVSNLGKAHPFGFKISAGTVMGGIDYSTALPSKIDNVKALKIQYLFDNSEESMEKISEWNVAYLEMVKEFAANSTNLEILTLTNMSVEAELEKGIVNQWWLAPMAFFATLFISCLSLGQLSLLHSRVLLAIFGTVLTILACIVAVAFSSLCQIGLSPFTFQVLPVLLMSIGIDNVFIITKAFNSIKENNKSITDQKALEMSLERVGPSMALSTTACAFVFSACLVLPVPAIRSLCFQIVFAVMLNLVLQVVCLSCAIILDAKRIEGRRMDVLFCIKLQPAHSPTAKSTNFKGLSDLYPNLIRATVGSKWLRAIVVCAFSVSFGLSLYFGITQVDTGLPFGDLLPEESYVKQYWNKDSIYFKDTGFPLFIVSEELDYENTATQEALVQLKHDIENNPTTQGPFNFWFSDFLSYIVFLDTHRQEYIDAGNRIPPLKFYEWLDEFLDSLGAVHRFNLVFNEGKIIASRMLGSYAPVKDTSQMFASMEKILDVLENSTVSGTFPYSPFYPLMGQFEDLFQNGAIAVTCSFVGIIFLIFLAAKDLKLICMSMGLLFMVSINALALGNLAGIKLNAMSLMVLASSIGMSTEYVSHLLTAYMSASGDSKERVLHATSERGAMILLSAVSSMAGLSVLLFAKLQLIRIYFALVWLIVFGSALLHSLVLFPILLTLFVPHQNKQLQELSYFELQEQQMEERDSRINQIVME